MKLGGELSSASSTYPKGRLLTPEEGCGFSKFSDTRIVGGSVAKNGKRSMRCKY